MAAGALDASGRPGVAVTGSAELDHRQGAANTAPRFARLACR